MVKPKIALPMKQRLRLWFVVQSRTSMDGPEDAIKTGGDNIPSSPPGRGFLMDPGGGGFIRQAGKKCAGWTPSPWGWNRWFGCLAATQYLEGKANSS